MQLKRIKVSGFKSFVDVTNITFNNAFTAVVGPNGCGKSNVIDAVRWVMGESSAKMLRGTQMEDVIFNGSKTRKPVSSASVELLFDNENSTAQHAYAQYAQIATKRVLTREGKSTYLINNQKVRRKDVVDLFRGTGLGPRSYSIIEQGMVSRIVEAKPEELRFYVEEAAGISKYKDRRRETETRIRQTRENLTRVDDVLSELDKQLKRLKKQSETAIRYRALLQQKDTHSWWLNTLKNEQYFEQLGVAKNELQQAETHLEKERALLAGHQNQIETLRLLHGKSQTQLADAQASFYQAAGEIAQIETQISFEQRRREEHLARGGELEQALEQARKELNTQTDSVAEMQQNLQQLLSLQTKASADLKQLRANSQQKEADFTQWQEGWYQVKQRQTAPQSTIQLQTQLLAQWQKEQNRNALKIDQAQRQLAQTDTDYPGLLQQAVEASLTAELKVERCVQALDNARSAEAKIAENRQTAQDTLQLKVVALAEKKARLTALTDTQQSQLTQDSDESLQDLPQVRDLIQVAAGWEQAVDSLLTPWLQAHYDEKAQASQWHQHSANGVALVSACDQDERVLAEINGLSSMTSVVRCQHSGLEALFANAFVANNLVEAHAAQAQLNWGQFIVTKQGDYLGKNWLRQAADKAQAAGYWLLAAEREELEQHCALLDDEKHDLTEQLQSLERSYGHSKHELDEQRRALKNAEVAYTACDKAQNQAQMQAARAADKTEQMRAALTELSGQQTTLEASIVKSQTLMTQTRAELEVLLESEAQEAEQGQQIKQQLADARAEFELQQGKAQKLALSVAETDAAMRGAERAKDKAQSHIQQVKLQLENWQQDNVDGDDPMLEFQIQLQTLLEARLQAQQALDNTQTVAATQASDLQQLERTYAGLQVTVEKQMQKAQALILAVQAKQIRLQQSNEALDAAKNKAVDAPARPESLTLEECSLALVSIQGKIQRIGAVNLMAIDEYDTELERSQHLKSQYDDLTQALETLDEVIASIDKETRLRFKKTYAALCEKFSAHFPKLFGGGKAELSLTDSDLLNTGITVYAQPPGKRNSTIHLLSGGEKALTAVALLFALFELNPAPFCMMDEVDAPLDDINVGRFCETIAQFAEKTQMIVITHSKITMQAANALIGVTQREKGVSKIVSVDVDAALSMVNS